MDLLEAVMTTFAVVGQEMPDIGLKAIVMELQGYPLQAVFEALTRCRKELRKITLADIIERIPTGHLGPEEAWGIVCTLIDDEDVSVVWTEEMAHAYGAARHLKADKVAARMAFKETYIPLVAQARDRRQRPVWRPSLGHDPHGRAAAIEEAVTLGRITVNHAKQWIPDFSDPASTVTLPAIADMTQGGTVSIEETGSSVIHNRRDMDCKT
jgi:hypothetical protein